MYVPCCNASIMRRLDLLSLSNGAETYLRIEGWIKNG